MEQTTNAVALARRAARDSGPDTQPASAFWQGASITHFSGDFYGWPINDHASQVLLQWTDDSLYLLFVCPYQKLNLRPGAQLHAETFGLWNWDVAEVYLGADTENIRRYKEFAVSPQGEWVDLDVNLDNPPYEQGWIWESGCSAGARIDDAARTWYGFLRIPWRSIDSRKPAVGSELRVNFSRCQSSDPNRIYMAWQAPGRASFHTPAVFGTLRLAE